MIVTSVVLLALMAGRRVSMPRVLFACFAVATIINCFYLLSPPRVFPKDAIPGYTGYFQGKNYLGGFAAVGLLLSLHELFYAGRRRVLGAVIGVLAMVLLVLSNSKTALVFAFGAPVLAAFAVAARKTMGLSPAIILVLIVLVYLVVTTLLGINIYRLSYALYGDSTFTGRRLIWEFAQSEIGRRPFFGWGYQSFWLVGPDAPSVVEAPGWVKSMPNAHNGYIDTTVEMGYVGFLLLLAFLLTTLHAAGQLVDHDSRRGWLVLALAFYILATNGLESVWMRGFEFLWVVFLFLAAEVGRIGGAPCTAGAVHHHRSAHD
jgi:exopolysaccharide production protein ExoQ